MKYLQIEDNDKNVLLLSTSNKYSTIVNVPKKYNKYIYIMIQRSLV